jgi:hypothetical protein
MGQLGMSRLDESAASDGGEEWNPETCVQASIVVTAYEDDAVSRLGGTGGPWRPCYG